MTDYAKLQRLIRSRADETGTGCTREQLEVVNQLFCELPVSYASFLKDFGWFRISQHEVIGFGADVPAHLDLIKIATWERELAYPPMSANLLPLENDGAGDHYCLDLAASTHPVIFWSHDDSEAPHQAPIVVAPNFVAWAMELFESRPS